MKIPLHRLDPLLPMPGHARAGDAGVDLYAREAGSLQPRERAMIPTGIALAIPSGYVGLVAPRSGLAVRHGISVVNGPGVIDAGFRGELNVVVINLGNEAWSYERGERVAQLVVVPFERQELYEVEELPESHRGDAGFGSTGK